MKLKELLVGLEGLKAKGTLDLEIKGIESNSKNIKEGTGSVEVVYEAGNENEIPRGEEVNALKTGDSFEVNTYLMVLTSALFLILLPLYYKEKKRESDENWILKMLKTLKHY